MFPLQSSWTEVRLSKNCPFISLRCRLMQTIHFHLNVATFIKMRLGLNLSFQTHKLVTDAQRKYF